jgi:hypothetical protein
MKIVAIISALAFFMAVAPVLADPGNFHKGDTWKYEYRKINSSLNNQINLQWSLTDSVSGKITFSLDSFAVKTDSVVWYIAKTDTLRETKIYETNDSVFLHDTASRLTLTIVNGVMQGDYKEFFSFDQSPDTSYDAIDTPISSLSYTRTYSLLTTVSNANVDNNIVPMFVRISALHFSRSGPSAAGSDNIDTLFWIDGQGLFQKRTLVSSESYNEGSITGYASFESYRLIQRNGNSVNITSIKTSKISQPVYPLQGVNKPLRYFDINGRVLGNTVIRSAYHGILLHQRPDGRWDKQISVH